MDLAAARSCKSSLWLPVYDYQLLLVDKTRGNRVLSFGPPQHKKLVLFLGTLQHHHHSTRVLHNQLFLLVIFETYNNGGDMPVTTIWITVPRVCKTIVQIIWISWFPFGCQKMQRKSILVSMLGVSWRTKTSQERSGCKSPPHYRNLHIIWLCYRLSLIKHPPPPHLITI